MSELYAKIVLAEDIDDTPGVTIIDDNNATRFVNLQSVSLPAHGGNLDWTQDIVLVHQDGSRECVQGHLLDSGVME